MTDLTDPEIMEMFEQWKESTKREITAKVDAMFAQANTLSPLIKSNAAELKAIDARLRKLEARSLPVSVGGRLRRLMRL